MTTRRLIASLSVSAAALLLAATVAVRSFPLQAQAEVQAGQTSSGEPVQIIKGGEHLLHAALPDYPKRAFAQGIEGDVLVELTVDDQGEVSDARVLAGPDELRRAALESALQWHYAPQQVRSTTVQAAMRFKLPAGAREVQFDQRGYAYKRSAEDEDVNGLTDGQRAERLMAKIEADFENPNLTDHQRIELKQMYENVREKLERARAEGGKVLFAESEMKQPGPKPEGPLRLVQIRSERVSPEVLRELVAQWGVKIGDPIDEETFKRLSKVVSEYDKHMRVTFSEDGRGGAIVAIITP